MLKGRGNINYFQKNKKIVLSFISVGFLTGAAVIDKDVPGREVADVHRIHPSEKLKVPPHRVVPKDKLSPVKPKNEPRALLYDGWVSVGNISGYDVKYRKFAVGSDYIYQILGTSGASQLGFACFCANINGTKNWRGEANSACDATNPNSPLKLDNPVMGIYRVYNVNIPDGSCCKSAPRVGTTFIPGLTPCG
ncbi:hypothetical protein [Methylobacter sp. sgz302048]|uniref:hypothetical protein n=1 Tax=Methylobacter sp. sgz302048 TaxID=3455945 RepID=UPI003FA0E151